MAENSANLDNWFIKYVNVCFNMFLVIFFFFLSTGTEPFIRHPKIREGPKTGASVLVLSLSFTLVARQ